MAAPLFVFLECKDFSGLSCKNMENKAPEEGCTGGGPMQPSLYYTYNERERAYRLLFQLLLYHLIVTGVYPKVKKYLKIFAF